MATQKKVPRFVALNRSEIHDAVEEEGKCTEDLLLSDSFHLDVEEGLPTPTDPEMVSVYILEKDGNFDHTLVEEREPLEEIIEMSLDNKIAYVNKNSWMIKKRSLYKELAAQPSMKQEDIEKLNRDISEIRDTLSWISKQVASFEKQGKCFPYYLTLPSGVGVEISNEDGTPMIRYAALYNSRK